MSKEFDPTLMSTEEILEKMTLMNSTRPGSIMGIWRASLCYKDMYKELIKRNYQGVIPPERYSPPPLDRSGNSQIK